MITLTNLEYAGKVVNGQLVGADGTVSVSEQNVPGFTALGFFDPAAGVQNAADLAAALTAAVNNDDPGIAIPISTAVVAVGGPQLLALTGIRPTGTLAALTLNFVDGITNGVARIVCTQVITALTITGNVDKDATRTLLAAPTALVANQMLEYWWDESSSTPCWIRAL